MKNLIVEKSQIASYQLLEKIAEGGMGIIYKAKNLSNNQIFAVKTFKEKVDLHSETFLHFKNEAAFLKELLHPNILSFVDLIEQDSRFYLVTEYIQGENLKKYSLSKNISLQDKLKIIYSIATALDFVHSKGIIHRDIKPGNIMINLEGVPKILDFGVSALVSLQKVFLNEKAFMGSFAYMAPEQSGVLTRTVDARSDLYSLGIVFYQLICGVLPYESQNIGELLHQHIAKRPKEPISIIEDLPPIVNDIILKLIQKDPDNRYQTAFGLAEDLKKLLKKESAKESEYPVFQLGKKDRLKNINFRTTIQGREAQIQLIQEKLDASFLPKGGVQFFLGKKGFGKTRLLEECEKMASFKETFFSQINSKKQSIQPFEPIIAIANKLLEQASFLSEKELLRIKSKLKQKLGDELAYLTEILPALTSLFRINPKKPEAGNFLAEHEKIFFKALKNFFFCFLFKSKPLIFAFDDVQFWDDLSIDFINYLAPFLKRKAFYIFLFCDEIVFFNKKEFSLRLEKTIQDECIFVDKLNYFSLEETQKVIKEIFPTLKEFEKLSVLVFDKIQGNPRLLIDNLKSLVEENVIFSKNQLWYFDEEAFNKFSFPSSLSQKLLKSFKALNAREKELLKVAAVFGKEFSFKHLIAFFKSEPSFSEKDIKEILSSCVSKNVLSKNLLKKEESVYYFESDIFYDKLMHLLSPLELKNIHKNCALVMEQFLRGRERIFQLARLYDKGEMLQESYEYNLLAADLSERVFSFQLSRKFLMNALNSVLKQEQEKHIQLNNEKLQLFQKIAFVSLNTGHFSQTVELIESFISQINESEIQNQSLAEIYYLFAKNYYFSGNHLKAMEYYHKVIPLAEKFNLKELLAVSYCAIGRAYCYIAHFKESIDYIKKGLKNLSDKNGLEAIYSYGILAQSYAGLGEKKKALEILLSINENYSSHKKDMHDLFLQFYNSSVYTMLGNFKKGLKESQKAYLMSKKYKNPLLEFFSLYNIGRCFQLKNKTEQAILYISQAIQQAKENNIYLALFLLYYSLAESYMFLGDMDKARDNLNEGKKYAGMANTLLVSLLTNRLEAILKLFSKNTDLELALNDIEKAIAAGKELGEEYKYYVYQCYLVKAGVLWRMNQKIESEALYKKAISLSYERDMQSDIASAKEFRKRYMSFSSTISSIYDNIDFNESGTFYIKTSKAEFYYQRQLHYLLKLSEQLSKVHQSEALFNKILSLAVELSGAERGLLFLYESSNKAESELVIKAEQNTSTVSEEKIAYSKAVLDETIVSLEGQLILNAEQELSGDKEVSESQMKSIISIPLITSAQIIGVIYLENRLVTGVFTKENFELLKAFAVESAISIENSRLYEKVQEQTRVKQEMEIAEDMQTSILPFIKESEDYELAAFMQTADEVGGDYYDFYLEEEPYFCAFGDVSGHGLKSGIIMMMAEVAFNTLVRSKEMRQKELPSLYQAINDTLYENIQNRLAKKSKAGLRYNQMYMTFRMLRFDKAGNCEMFGNDHAEPFICRKNGEIKRIKSKGFLLGILEEATLEQESEKFKLERGDLIVFYSDGISEAKNISKEQRKERKKYDHKKVLYGSKRLVNLVKENRDKNVQEIIDIVIESVHKWMKVQEDDITLLIVKKK